METQAIRITKPGRILLASLLAAGWILVGNGAKAMDYEPFGLECLLMASDAVVVANLPEGVQGETYRMQVTRSVRGDLPNGDLEIAEPAQFRGTPPEFASREALFFLKQVGDRWEVLGPSGEGRVQLYARDADVTAIRLPVSGSTTRYPREELLSAIQEASSCFLFQRTVQGVEPVSRCDPAHLDLARKSSGLHEGLIRTLLDPNRKPCSPL